MSDYNKCRICGSYDWLNMHTCPPEWDILCPDWNGDDPYTVRAHNADDAAAEWGDRYD